MSGDFSDAPKKKKKTSTRRQRIYVLGSWMTGKQVMDQVLVTFSGKT